MHDEDEEVFDVIQIGYGPVGQSLAALLGQRGHRVAVFERWPELYGRARAGHLDHEIMRIFQSVGAAEAVERDAHLAERYEFRDGDGRTLMSFDYGAEAVSGWRSDYIVYQPDVEDALNTAVRAHPSVQLHQGWEASFISQDEDAVVVTARPFERAGGDASGGEDFGDGTGSDVGTGSAAQPPRTVRGRYLVAADGANSPVRSALGIPWIDLGFHSTWLVVDLVPTAPLSFDFDDGQVCDPARPHCLFQLGAQHRRFEFMGLPGEDQDLLGRAETAWTLMAPYGVTPANARIERHAVYTFGSSVASRWRQGRVLLAGDAAHLMPPFLGQGMCSGIRDAANLAWRLDLVLTGRADAALLETYETERAPHAESLVRMSIKAGEVACTLDPVVAEARDQAFRSGLMPPMPPFPHLEDGLLAGRDDPLSGRLAPQGRVRADGRVARFDDVFGTGWTLLSRTPVHGYIDAAGKALLDRLDARVIAVEEAADVDGCYRDYFAKTDVSAILYRPDFHIFGSAANPGDLPALLGRLNGLLPGVPASTSP